MAREGIRELLEDQVAQSESELEAAVSRLLVDFDAVLTLRKDVESLRGSIEAISRGNGHPYIAQPVTTAADFILELADGRKLIGQAKAATPSKQGIIRKAIRENPGLKIREIWEKIQESKPGIEILVDDVHRGVARMKAKEHVKRAPDGGVTLTEKAPKD